ncbi:MAG: alginate export family protein [Candidatus Omnitrophica bacterium]|nr:alginate export family protein [Candidatus Omnitrophota bacterium]
MSKRLILILALAFVVGVTCAAYAEVQNVKVSGDLTVMGVGRANLDLAKEPASGARITQAANNNWADKSADVLSIARIRVDADLTDNVSTSIRLLSERPWNGEGGTHGGRNGNIGLNIGTNAGATIGTGAWTNDSNRENKIDIDLAYVTMKEFLYSPLTLTVGRQLLRFGNGLIVGDPDTNIYSVSTALYEGDLSARKSFDAVRATLDYNPLVIDAVYAKVEEGQANLNDDVTLMGLNAAYDMGRQTTLEGYFFSKIKGSQAAWVYGLDAQQQGSVVLDPNNKNVADKVNTVGLRAVNKTIKNLTLDVQGAYQFGTYNPKFDPNMRSTGDGFGEDQLAETCKRSAFAFQAEATYDLKDISMLTKYSPAITGNYTYLSGAGRDKVGRTSYKGWDPMFEDQTYGHLMNAIMANTNMHRIAMSGKAKLTDDIGVKLDYVASWFAKRYPEGRLAVLSGIADSSTTARVFRMGKERFIGQEVDVTVTYDYTEDVQFSLMGGVFSPSRAINDGYQVDTNVDGGRWPHKASAQELIGSMKVTF